MTEKRFSYMEQFNGFCDVYDRGKILSCMRLEYVDKTVDLLNKQHETMQVLKASNGEMEDYLARLEEENEQLKTIRSDLICELDIVQNELNIAIDKGFAPSTSYKNYMASKKTEYDKFWENKIKTHNNRLNGVRE